MGLELSPNGQWGFSFNQHHSAPGNQNRNVTAKRLRLLLLIVILFLAGARTLAQSTGSIEGRVTDQQGGLVPGVEVTASSSEISIRRSTLTDDSGRYLFVALPVATYTVEVRGTGFQTQVIKSLTLDVARRVTQNFQLRVGNVSELVTVSTGSTLIESSTTSVGHLVIGE